MTASGRVGDQVLEILGSSGVDVRAAAPDDAVDGVLPAAVAHPVDTEEVAALLRLAAAQRLVVVARGSGTKLDWGLPPRQVDLLVDTTRMDRVLEHAAGDLVVHAQAGVPLDVLQRVLGGAGQRLALDPMTNPGTAGSGTVGGVLATAADGPLRLAHGAPRDLVIGMTIVRADGVVARAGGKVVKNVAGYDLSKLLTGSWGTLGIITEAVFRLHPLPAARRWVVATAPEPDRAVARAAAATASQAVSAAVELDRPAGGEVELAVLVEGGAAGLEARAGAISRALGGGAVSADAPAWWGRAAWASGGTALRLTSTQRGVSSLLAALDALPLPIAVRGSAGVGKLFAGLAADADPALVARCVDMLRERRGEWGGDVVVLRAPAPVRALVDAWGPVSAPALMRRVKHEFDPEARLAPGRFAGGI